MEKEIGDPNHKIIFIALTGPECTGKSTLAQQLAAHYNSSYIPEYARDYVAGLKRPYVYEDVLHIAETQVNQKRAFQGGSPGIVFLDTYLIITKVWMDVVFNTHPAWIENELNLGTVDLYLLCSTDISWESDPVRENGGEMREYLFKVYKKELENYGCNYRIIKGKGDSRLRHAIQAVDAFIRIPETGK